MNIRSLLSIALSVALASAGLAERVETFTIQKNRDFERIERLMNASEADAVTVEILEGRYVLKDSFHVNRSKVKVVGKGEVVLTLGKRVQAPVIAIGSQSSYPLENERIESIELSQLVIDGNQAYQDSEYNQALPWIRKNGIDARVVTGLHLSQVTSRNNRSGGFVVSWRCHDVLARDCVFEDNYFDGVAYYDSSNVFTVDCTMRNNKGAGVSLDNAFVDSFFIRCQIEGNRDVGVFARHSERLVFQECTIANSGNWAVFLAHDEKEHGVFDIDFASCLIERNNGGIRMGSVTEEQSARNSVTLATFRQNETSGRPNVSTAGSELYVFDEVWSAGVSEEESEVIPYSKRVYQALSRVDQLDQI